MKSRSHKHSVSVNRHRWSGSRTSSSHNRFTYWVIRNCLLRRREKRRLRRMESFQLMRSRLCVEKSLANEGFAILFVHGDFLLPSLFRRNSDTFSVRTTYVMQIETRFFPFLRYPWWHFSGNVKLTFQKRKMKSWKFVFRLCYGGRMLLRMEKLEFNFFRGSNFSAQQIFRFGFFQIFFRLSLYNGNWRSFLCRKSFLFHCLLVFSIF